MSAVTMRNALGWLGRALGLALLAYLGTCAAVALRMSRPRRLRVLPPPDGCAYEELRFASLDGTPLSGWLFSPARALEQPAAVVLVHGIGKNRHHEAAGQQSDRIAFLVGAGYQVLALDLRGHGRSGSGRVSLGQLEARDVAAAIDLLRERGLSARRIVLYGESLGAASALQALGLRPGVGPVIADSAYSDGWREMREALPVMTRLPAFFAFGLALVGYVMGLRIDQVRPLRMVRAGAARPYLFIHVRGDRTVRAYHSLRLRAASTHPHTRLYLAPGEEHVGAWKADPARYRALVLDFLERALAEEAPPGADGLLQR